MQVLTSLDRKKKYELLDEQRAEDILSFFQGVAPSKIGEEVPNWVNGLALPKEDKKPQNNK